MKTYQNLTVFAIILSAILFFGCTEERQYKSFDIVGYWEAKERLHSYKNGQPNPVFHKTYYVKFSKENCGYLFNEDEEWTNDMKWAIQEREHTDKLLISYALNSNGVSTNLYHNTLNIIDDFTTDSFIMYRFESNTYEENLYTRHYLTEFRRVE